MLGAKLITKQTGAAGRVCNAVSYVVHTPVSVTEGVAGHAC